MKVVPQLFYKLPKIEKILVDGLSCVIKKTVEHAGLQNQRYLASHAITLVLKGTLRVEASEGEMVLVNKNQMVLLPKGIYMISDIIPKDEPFEAIIFFFDSEITDEFLTNYESTRHSYITNLLQIDYDQNLRLFVDTLVALYQGKNQNQFTKAKLLEFLHLISLTNKGTLFIHKLQSIKNRERKNIKVFMSENFDKPLDIEDYAYLTGRSISTFRRDFKSKFNISPKKWLIEKRLQQAAILLKEKNDSITNIALLVGYENTSHFIKAFQKKFKTSPKQFQIRHRKDLLI